MDKPFGRYSLVRVTGLTILALLVGAALILAAEAGGDKRKTPRKDLEKRLKTLRSVPYTTTTREEVDPGTAGVVRYKPSKSHRGYNFYCSTLSSRVILMDMTGTVVHTWSYPDRQNLVWDHAEMLDNGDVLVIRKFRDLLRLNWDSVLMWKNPIESHHEITVLPDSTLYVVARELHTHRGLRIRFPAIAHLSADGEEIGRWSTYDHLDEIKAKFDQRSFIDALLDSLIADGVDPETWKPLTAYAESVKAELDARPRRYDQFHMNTISIIPETPLGKGDSRFRAGNLLICFRNINQIAALDGDTNEILWVWGEGELDWPHHPTMVESGNILIFDNGTNRHKYSRVIELNPVTGEIEWEYLGDPPEFFFTPARGSAQRLPNGNTLICEGDRGRSFEITRDGEIVWEWYNPEMRGKHREQVYRMIRIPTEVVEPLLRQPR
jgi:hypothetical protein